MFYCDDCAKKYGYPPTAFKSEGPCESCDKVAICNDQPSKRLPLPAKTEAERARREQLYEWSQWE